MKNNSKQSKIFHYVIIAAVLIIPFMYSFFYLKAYWNPYGKGNIDNLPIAIVNLDEGSRGKEIINGIKEKNTLKLSITNSEKADSGLNDGTYYAVITIPKDFSDSINSVSTTEKKHPTITYSPNQKSNYLASQIIDKVVTTVEANLDNTINSNIVNTLSNSLTEIPDQLDTINSGFDKLSDGTSALYSGSNTLVNGTNTLASSYQQFDDGINSVKNGSNDLNNGINQLNSGINELATKTEEFNKLSSMIPTLTSSVENLKNGSDDFTTNMNSYVDSVNSLLPLVKVGAQSVITSYETACNNAGIDPNAEQVEGSPLYESWKSYQGAKKALLSLNTLEQGGNSLKEGNAKINNGLNTLNTSVTPLNTLPYKITQLTNGVSQLQAGSNKLVSGSNTLNNGISTLANSSVDVKNGIISINNGNVTLNNGIKTLNSSVYSAKNELSTKVNDSKEQISKVNNLTDYSKKPVAVDKKVVNEISSYGTAFSPFFISIALWVGCLMMYIIFYFDKEDRFPKLSASNKNRYQRSLYYHGLASLAGLILGILLMTLLDFSITNYFLYFISIILIANLFIAIIEFLIMQFKDIGKFIALILLVLQLAAAGGTFPIETVTKGFRFLNGMLPMTYTVKLLRESLVTIESSLLTKNLVIVICILLGFVILNLISNVYHIKKDNK